MAAGGARLHGGGAPFVDLNEVMVQLAELSVLLDAATEEIALLDEAAVRATWEHEVVYATALIRAGGAADVRKSTATLMAKDSHLSSELAAAKVRACRERIRTLRDQIEIRRSLGSALKAQWAAEPAGQWT